MRRRLASAAMGLLAAGLVGLAPRPAAAQRTAPPAGQRSAPAPAAAPRSAPAAAARRYRIANERAIVDQLVALLSIPNVARDEADMRRNAALLEAMFRRRGARTRLLE